MIAIEHCRVLIVALALMAMGAFLPRSSATRVMRFEAGDTLSVVGDEPVLLHWVGDYILMVRAPRGGEPQACFEVCPPPQCEFGPPMRCEIVDEQPMIVYITTVNADGTWKRTQKTTSPYMWLE